MRGVFGNMVCVDSDNIMSMGINHILTCDKTDQQEP
jgi:hypothetical protein